MKIAITGGSAHLLNFTGSDTLAACYYVQFALNNGKPIGTSIPATEHSVMTAWHTEREALKKMIEQYGTGVFATVMDSYDYSRALNKVSNISLWLLLLLLLLSCCFLV